MSYHTTLFKLLVTPNSCIIGLLTKFVSWAGEKALSKEYHVPGTGTGERPLISIGIITSAAPPPVLGTIFKLNTLPIKLVPAAINKSTCILVKPLIFLVSEGKVIP